MYPDVTEDGRISRSKKVTIGVYNDFDEACLNGNDLLQILEGKFELHQFPDGRKSSKERFSKNGGCFGSKKSLITNLAYLRTPFKFYAKIDTLKHDPINEAINDVLDSVKRYKAYRLTDEG